MRRPRRNHTAAFKAKVAIAALKGDETLAALAEKRSGPRKLDSWLSDISALLSDASRRPTGAERDEKTPP